MAPLFTVRVWNHSGLTYTIKYSTTVICEGTEVCHLRVLNNVLHQASMTGTDHQVACTVSDRCHKDMESYMYLHHQKPTVLYTHTHTPHTHTHTYAHTHTANTLVTVGVTITDYTSMNGYSFSIQFSVLPSTVL